MGKLVVVSNRLPPLPQKGAASRSQEVGGLVSALLSALDMKGGGIWFGWTGKANPDPDADLVTWEYGDNRITGFHLTQKEVDAYYNGFCNRALWPMLHSFQGRVHITRSEDRIYAQVNRRIAQRLAPLLDADDTVWVHDYHLILLGRELRNLGFAGPIGYFLHVPFPAYYTWQILPHPRDYLAALMSYDLIGFHTRTYRDNYVYASQRLLSAEWDGDVLRTPAHAQRAAVFPIGIDPARWRSFSKNGKDSEEGRRRRLIKEAGGRKVVIGVDRLDYTKGVPERFLAFEALLRSYPRYRNQVMMFQVCAPSRTRVPEYIQQKREVESLVGRINGEFSEYNWMPIAYLYRSYPQNRLAEFYRDSHACIITPLRDGMNLVSKEFIAAQDPDDPGVLVLSRFTGAAEELRDAVLVNPYLPEDVADGLHRAFSMPLRERKERYHALNTIIERHDAEWWIDAFLRQLDRPRPDGRPSAQDAASFPSSSSPSSAHSASIRAMSPGERSS